MEFKIGASSKSSLECDKKVLGKRWLKTYKGYFGDRENIGLFVRKALPLIPKKRLVKILYPCSASGLLGEALVKGLGKNGVKAGLVLVDISEKHLKENKNKKTRKVLADVQSLGLEEKFDVIIMRSSLDYFPSEKMQVKVLSVLNRHLANNGVFFNQAASMPSIAERNLADRIYASGEKIGRRHFQCGQDIGKIYAKASFEKPEILGEGKHLALDEKDHAKRYGIGKKEIAGISKIIGEVPEKKRPNIRLTKKGYEMEFVFQIYIAEKKKAA